MKRILCFVFAGIILLSLILSGCEKMKQSELSDSDSDAERAIQERIESGNYPKIVMAIASFTGPSKGAARVNEAIKAYTEKTYGISLEIRNYDSGNYVQQMQLAFAAKDQVDLFSCVLIGYANAVNQGYALDLEQGQLLEKYGSEIVETVGLEYVETCRIKGNLYGIPNIKEYSNGIGGIFIPKVYLDTIGFDYESIMQKQRSDRFVLDNTIWATYEMVDGIFAQLKQAYPDKYVFGPQENENHAVAVDFVGGDCFGVLFDDSETLELESMFENEQWLEYVRHVYMWNQAGYISPDALTDTTDVNLAVQKGEILTWLSNTKPGQAEAYDAVGGCVCFMLGDYFSASDAVNGMPWCIGANCVDPVAAMQILNALYNDPVLVNLIGIGEEGKDYVLHEDGTLGLPEDMSAEGIEYSLGVIWELPNQFLIHSAAEQWDAYSEMNEASKKSLAAGFVFDNSSIESEYFALTNVYSEYRSQLMLGFVNPDEVVPELMEKLNAAGYDKYVAEKQRQLNLWAEENSKG